MSERRRYDPRLGDEDCDEHSDVQSPISPPRTPKHVQLQLPDDDPHDAEKTHKKPDERRPSKPLLARVVNALPFNFAWIPANFTRSKMKPVIRCAVVCWVSALFMIIPQTMNLMGQVCPLPTPLSCV